MERKIYKDLIKWKNESRGRSALLIEGARRVGKSYIVEEFGKNEYKSYLIINFDNVKKNIKSLFDDLTDIDRLLLNLSVRSKITFYERNTLIVFDEVQKFPRAREAIKALVENGKYDYIETGSLISIHENVKDILIPSEEESIEMFPMDFEEFLWATSDVDIISIIRDHYESKEPLGNVIHESIMDRFRKYMLVGGMPQAVLAYSKNERFEDAEREKRKILKVYREDIAKKSVNNQIKTSMLFEMLPTELERRNKTINLADFDENGKYPKYDEPMFWLKDSKIVNLCFDTSVPTIQMKMYVRYNSVKLFMGDTGLLVTMSIAEEDPIRNDIYEALLMDRLHINEGMFTENVVAQILRANGHQLFFHTFYMNEKSKNRYEVDFLIRNGNKISPVEVKSSDYTSHSSLDCIMKRYSKTMERPIVIYTKDLKKKDGILFIPIYMAFCL